MLKKFIHCHILYRYIIYGFASAAAYFAFCLSRSFENNGK